MLTSSNGNIFRVTGHLCGEFTGRRWIACTNASDAEPWCFVWAWTNGWVNRDAGDLRRHRAHHDVTVMDYCPSHALRGAPYTNCFCVIINIDGLVQDCSIYSALAMEILQSCIKPSIYRVQDILQNFQRTFILYLGRCTLTKVKSWDLVTSYGDIDLGWRWLR